MASKELFTQVKLVSGNMELECWVPRPKKLSRGTKLTLKDHHNPDAVWVVSEVYSTKSKDELPRSVWDNDWRRPASD